MRLGPSRAWLGCWLAVFAAIWLAALAGRSLIGPDEGRYATLSLGMLHSGDWITPRLNGLLYFEKPPLQYWGGALSLWLFGVNEFAARLWPGLAGLATVFLVGFTARRLWGVRTGWHALMVCGSTTWIVANSHFLTLDAGLAAALTLTLCGVLIAQHPDSSQRSQARWMLAAWAGVGLAVLSKGLIGVVIPGAVLVLHSLWRLDFSVWRRMHWLAGGALLLCITLPWFALVSARNPDFAWFFFIHEHFQRYLTTVHRRTGAWWYFVPILLVGMLPWTSALPWLLRARRSDFATSLLLVWSVFVFVFFSASGSKLPSVHPADVSRARVAGGTRGRARIRARAATAPAAPGAVLGRRPAGVDAARSLRQHVDAAAGDRRDGLGRRYRRAAGARRGRLGVAAAGPAAAQRRARGHGLRACRRDADPDAIARHLRPAQERRRHRARARAAHRRRDTGVRGARL